MTEALHFLRFRHMENQGVILGTALGLKDSGNGVFIQAVGTQAVNRFRGNGHQAAVFDDFRRNGRRIRVFGGQEQGIHSLYLMIYTIHSCTF